jgi:hypothetical protein
MDDHRTIDLLEIAYLGGIPLTEIESSIKSSQNWNTWIEKITGLINGD